MGVTIKDVAKKTGLSLATISKYMNGGKVRDKNKLIIDEAVKELGYIPNKAARGLKTSRTFTIGVIVDEMANQYFALLLEQIEMILNENGYSMAIACHKGDPEVEIECLKFFMEQNVDGILAVPADDCCTNRKTVEKSTIPVVALDRLPHSVCDCVASNDATGAYSATEYLINCGHKKIAVITGKVAKKHQSLPVGSAVDRLNGYLRAMNDYGYDIKKDYIQQGDFSLDAGARCMENLLKNEDRPTAVFVTNYNMTLGAIATLHKYRVEIPAELSVAAFDDLEFSVISRPQLTAVRQPFELNARKSVMLLLKRIKGDYTGFPETIRNPTKLMIRDSVKVLKNYEV